MGDETLRSGEAGVMVCSLLPCLDPLRESIPGDWGLWVSQMHLEHKSVTTHGAGFLFLPKKLNLSLLSILFFFLCPSELELSRLLEFGVTGLAGTLVATVLGGMTDRSAVENEGAPSRIASIGGWLELDFLPCVWFH